MPVRRRAATMLATLSLLAAGVAVTGCESSSEERAAQRQARYVEIWSLGRQYVRLEPPLSRVAGRPPQNAHPVRITPEQLRHALGLLSFRESSGESPRPLFAEHSLGILSRNLPAGLAQASPDLDVTFAVERDFSGILGLTDTRAISGRVFFDGRWLNLVLGSVLADSTGDEDLRPDPYAPGRRDADTIHKAILSVPPGAGVYRAPGVAHGDWLLFGPQALGLAPAAPQPGPPAGQPGYGYPGYGYPGYGAPAPSPYGSPR